MREGKREETGREAEAAQGALTAASPVSASVFDGVIVPTLPDAVTPDKATVNVGDTVPTEPDAASPVSGTVLEGVTVPTFPDADTPLNATVMFGVWVPTLPVADTPVRATTTVTSPSDENGACENADIPNMVYGLRRLRLGCCKSQQSGRRGI